MSQVHAPTLAPASFDPDLQELREHLVAEGLHGSELAEVLDVAHHVAAHPHDGFHCRQAIARPAALAERLRATSPRRTSSAASLGSFIFGVVLGPILAYAALGNPWNTYPADLPRIAAAGVGVVLVLLLLAVTSRYRHPAALGALAGVGGGLAQMAVASVPWLGIASVQPACTPAGTCSVSPGMALGYAIVALVLYAVPLTLSLAAVASAVGYWSRRRRIHSAVCHA